MEQTIDDILIEKKPKKPREYYAQRYWYKMVDWAIFVIARPFFKRNVRRIIREFDANPLWMWPKMKNELSWDMPEYMEHVRPFWWMNSKYYPKIKYFWQNSRIYSKAKMRVLTAVSAYVYTKLSTKDYFKYHHTTNCGMTLQKHEEWWKEKGKEMEDNHRRWYDWNKYKHLI